MKRTSTITFTGLIGLVASLAAAFAIAAPAGQAATVNLTGVYGDGFAQTEYTCLSNGKVNLNANLVSTGAPGTSVGQYMFFQTRVHRLTSSGWVDMGYVDRPWIWAGVGGPHQFSFPVGYGTVRFMTTFAIWNNALGKYVYTNPVEETFQWSSHLFNGVSNRCTL
jgi:hypothetical protein